MKTKITMLGCPDVCIYHDVKDENVIAEVDLAGIKKKDISVEAGEEGFCIKAERDDVKYDSCYRFDNRVDTKRIRASFDNGLLKLTAPIDKRELHAKRINIL